MDINEKYFICWPNFINSIEFLWQTINQIKHFRGGINTYHSWEFCLIFKDFISSSSTNNRRILYYPCEPIFKYLEINWRTSYYHTLTRSNMLHCTPDRVGSLFTLFDVCWYSLNHIFPLCNVVCTQCRGKEYGMRIGISYFYFS